MYFETIAKVIAERMDIDVESIKPESTFADLKIDSLDTVDMVMNLEDILEAGKPKNGRVEKRRIKTGQPLTIRIEPEVQAIIDKYKGGERLVEVLGKCRNYGNYLHRANNALKRIGQTYNPHTREWEGEAVVPCLSFYYARYSWATIAAGLDIPERTVGAAMGHGTARSVTSIYMRVDMRKKIDDANRKVIDFCFGDLESSDK